MADNRIGTIRCAVLLFCASLCFSSLAYGQKEHGAGLADGNGRQLVTLVCSQCHGLKEIEILRDGQKGWQETVDRMVLYGAQLSPSEADLVTRYLATQLGPGKGSMQGGNGAGKVVLPAGPGKDLVATRCVLCHDLGRVVSPARSKADWVSVTNDMVQRGLQATPAETQAMISYLQANFSTSTSEPSAPTTIDSHR